MLSKLRRELDGRKEKKKKRTKVKGKMRISMGLGQNKDLEKKEVAAGEKGKEKKKKKVRFSGTAAGEKGNKRKKGSRFKGGFFWAFGQQHRRKEEVFGLVFFIWSELELQERRLFLLLLDNYSSKAGFLLLVAFGRWFLLLFSVFFFISYFQFVLEDDQVI